MQLPFEYQDLWNIVEGGFEKQNDGEDVVQQVKYAKTKDVKARNFIYQQLILWYLKVANERKAKYAWNILVIKYKGVGSVKKVRKQTLRRKFKLLQLEKSKSISDHFPQTLSLMNQMKANRENAIDLQVIEKVFRTLTIMFEYIATIIEKSKGLTNMTLDGLVRSLMAHEQRMMQKQELKSEEALESQTTSKKEVDPVKNDADSSKKGQNHKYDKRNGDKNW